MDAYSPAVMISKVTGSVPRFFQYQPCCPHEGGFEGPFILLRVFALFVADRILHLGAFAVGIEGHRAAACRPPVLHRRPFVHVHLDFAHRLEAQHLADASRVDAVFGRHHHRDEQHCGGGECDGSRAKEVGGAR